MLNDWMMLVNLMSNICLELSHISMHTWLMLMDFISVW